MGEVVPLSTTHMSDPDLNAIATYLKSLPGKTGGSALPERRLHDRRDRVLLYGCRASGQSSKCGWRSHLS